MNRSLALIGLTALFAACNGEEPEPELSDVTGCDPMDTELCALPYPSNYFTVADDSTETGLRVNFWEHSLPGNIDDVPFDPTRWNAFDGFSVSGGLLAWFDDVSLAGTIPLDDLAAYEDADAKTVILNAETGERVPHFVELDMTTDDAGERLLMLRPVERLEFGTRYIVGIRGLEKNSGGSVDVSTAFAATRDGTATTDGDVELRRDHYDANIFPALETAGFARGDLQLAWDFTTASRDSLLGDMMWVRDDALSVIDAGLTYVIDEIENRDCSSPNNGRVIEAHIEDFPLYRTADSGGSGLFRDESGAPARNGTRNVPFTVRIPCSAVEDPAPRKIIQYGHGFFGDRGESGTSWLREWSDANEFVIVAANWTGMEEADAPMVAAGLAQSASNFHRLPEGTYQGFAEFMAVLRVATEQLPNDDATKFMENEQLVGSMDGSDFAYYGISQGGILGGAYVGLSPDLDRAVLGVTGGPYSFLTHRSADFEPFFEIIKAKYDDHREINLLIQNFQLVWDAGDNTGWGYDMNRDVPAGYPSKTVLIQNAIGDSQVSTFAGHLQARMYGASTVAPQTRPIFGIDERTAPFTGSAIVEWEYSDLEPEPLENIPANHDTDPHECPRRNEAGQEQVVHFLNTGEVEQFCDGACIDIREGCR